MSKTTPPSSNFEPRYNRPERRQVEWMPWSLDQLVPADHRIRVIWRYVKSLDLSPLDANVRAVEGSCGRNPVDPRILMTLWMFATIEGISSARQIAKLCKRDVVYMWVCGGVGVNYHLLSDFRTDHHEFLEQLLVDSVATLMHQDLVTLDVVAQDGMRVRASAGGSSFRRGKSLEKCRDEARQHVERLSEERENQSNAANGHREAAQARAARERLERVEKALEELDELQAKKEKRKKGTGKEARASTTDPEARNMKMANGGYRPAYNVQFATDGGTRIIVELDVTNSGSDRSEMAPMHQRLVDNYEKAPKTYMVDCGFATKEDITTLEQAESRVLAPIYGEKKMIEAGSDPYERKEGDTDEMFTFRQRMATEEAKKEYKLRPSIAEFPNAVCRNHGLHQFRVRGLVKVKAVALWHALTHNLQRMMTLGYIT